MLSGTGERFAGDEDAAVDLMTIGAFAEATGLTPKALRLYDESGLVVPVDVDAWTGYRRYAPEQVERARRVARLRRLGMPLARVAEVVDLPARAASAALTSWAREVTAQAAATAVEVDRLVRDLAPDGAQEEVVMTSTTPIAVADVGHRVEQGSRASQEDVAHVGERLVVVADGVGDSPGVAARALAAFVADDPRSLAELDAATATAAAALTGTPPGGGSTLTAALVGDGELLLAHLGDSRAYRVRGGVLEQLTRDHNLVQGLVDGGRLTPEEARLDERRPVLVRALAPEGPAQPDLAVHPVQPGDRVVLTTDGVHARLTAAALADLLLADAPAQDVADAVVAAVEAAGADDNLTVVVLDLA